MLPAVGTANSAGETFTGLVNSSGGLIYRKSISNLDPGFWQGSTNGGSITVGDVNNMPYKYHPWIYAGCWAIVKNVSRMPFVLYYQDNPEELIFDHPILDMLSRPNPLMTSTPFIQSILLSMLLPSNMLFGTNTKGGQCFLLPISGAAGVETPDLTRPGTIPSGFIPLNDKHISSRTMAGDDGLESVTGWKMTVYGKVNREKIYGVNELIRVYQFNPYNALQGLANVTAAQAAIMQDVQSDVFNSNTLANSGRPDGILKSTQMLTQPQRDEALKSWYKVYGGPSNSGKIAVLGSDVDFKPIALSQTDMQMKELRADAMTRIAAVLGLNKIAYGMYEGINYATIKEGRKMLWRDTYLPTAKMIIEAMNASWVRYVEPGLRIRFYSDDIEELQPDRKTQSLAVKTFVEAGVPTLEALRLTGVPTGTDWPTLYPWMIKNPKQVEANAEADATPADNAAAAPAENIETRIFKKEVDADALHEAQMKYWENYVTKTLDPGEKEYKTAYTTFFQEQRNGMLDAADEWLAKQEKAVKAITLEVTDIVNGIKEQNKKIIEMSIPLNEHQLLRTENELAGELGDLVNWNASNKMAIAYTAKRRKILQGINTTTFKKVEGSVNDIIKDAVENNWTPQKTAKELKKVINTDMQVRRNQAATIARTEVGSITSWARFDAMKAEKFEYHEWITAGDEKVRTEPGADHVTAGAESNNPVKIGDPFAGVGNTKYPLDSAGGKKNVINCRCVAVAAVKENKYYIINLGAYGMYVYRYQNKTWYKAA